MSPLPFVRRLALRLASAVLVLLASATVTFFVLHLIPGDIVTAILGGPTANPTPEAVAAAIREYGLDRPLLVQYGLYLGRLLHGDLGISFTQHLPVFDVLRTQMGPTLELMVSALATAWGLALLSVLCTTRRSPLLSRLGTAIETVGAGLPQMWLGILLLWLFSFTLRLFPPAGSSGVATLVLPTLTLAIPLGGFLAQVTREALELALDQPFIVSARTRGLGEAAVRLRHALRHALLPGISLSAWATGALIGNAVVVETIFSRKGLGRELFLAVSMQDMPLTIGIVLAVTLAYIFANLLVDILYGLVDPRLKVSSR
jgi:peptide/nickel transport system permease protein